MNTLPYIVLYKGKWPVRFLDTCRWPAADLQSTEDKATRFPSEQEAVNRAGRQGWYADEITVKPVNK